MLLLLVLEVLVVLEELVVFVERIFEKVKSQNFFFSEKSLESKNVFKIFICTKNFLR